MSLTYRALPGASGELVDALEMTRLSRRRTGARQWQVWQDGADPDRFVEQFVVASWEEHERQHERVSERDQGRLDRVRDLVDPAHPVVVTHWLVPATNHGRRPSPDPH